MIESLKLRGVPQLRESGFRGSFPHFRRPRTGQTDLASFQFDKHGGGFVVEIAKAKAGDYTTSWGKSIPVSRLRADDLPPHDRLRPGATGPEGDNWFRHDVPRILRRRSRFNDLCDQVLGLLELQAETWWGAA